MPIPCYLALTAAEFAKVTAPPEKIAWMACHFSCYGTGLSNFPRALPPGCLIILNDRTPPYKHDPQRILAQLLELTEAFQPDGFLLDFQRGGLEINKHTAQVLTRGLPCPVGVTAEYAADLDCPVFLDPPPLHMALSDYLAPWTGREIWLEAALETRTYTVTGSGCELKDQQNAPLPQPVFSEPAAFSQYHIQVSEAAVTFTLQRTKENLDALCSQADSISRMVGLYQQLHTP